MVNFNHHEENEKENRYLLFWLGQELYGTPLLGVREVVEYQKAKPIPNTVKSFIGVINIRGSIVGAFDLRLRFGYPAQASKITAMMVFETGDSAIAAVTDKMEGVVAISENSIESKPKIEARVNLDFIIGVASIGDRLVTLIDLTKVLQAEEIANLGVSAKSVA